MPEEQRLEQKAVSKAAEIGISTQIDAAEKIDVDVQTDLFKMVQGQADEITISGEGVVMQKDIRVQELELQTDSVSINPLSAIFGQIELNQPVNANARIVLTEADINNALTSDFVRSKLQKFDLNVDGEIVGLEAQEIKINLPGGGIIGCSGTILIHEQNNQSLLGFTALASPRTATQPVRLLAFNCTRGKGFTLEMVAPLMQKLKELVNLPYLELEDMALRITEMEVEQGSLTLIAEAYVRQLPSM